VQLHWLGQLQGGPVVLDHKQTETFGWSTMLPAELHTGVAGGMDVITPLMV
jgi:hypothetical protein